MAHTSYMYLYKIQSYIKIYIITCKIYIYYLYIWKIDLKLVGKETTWKICSFSANDRIKHTIRVIYTIIRYTQCILKYTCNIYILFVYIKTDLR